MSTLQRAKLADAQQIGTSAGALYDNAGSTTTLVTGLTLFNGNTTTETVKIYVVPASGGALGTAVLANQIMEIPLTTLETLFVEFPFGITLTLTHDSIQASTTTASKVTALVHGDKLA